MALHNTVFSDHWFVKYYFPRHFVGYFRIHISHSVAHFSSHVLAREINQKQFKLRVFHQTDFPLASCQLLPVGSKSMFHGGKPLQISANKRQISQTCSETREKRKQNRTLLGSEKISGKLVDNLKQKFQKKICAKDWPENKPEKRKNEKKNQIKSRGRKKLTGARARLSLWVLPRRRTKQN